MPLGIGFWEDFGGFSVPKWSLVASKILLKIDVNLESHFLKKPRFSSGKTMILMVQEVHLGNQNRPEIDQNSESEMSCLWTSDFSGFCGILDAKLGLEKGAKTRQDRTRKDKTGQDRTRQYKTRQRQDKTKTRQRQDKTKTRQDKTLGDKESEGTFCGG